MNIKNILALMALLLGLNCFGVDEAANPTGGSLLVSYEKTPTTLYIGEVFEIKLKAVASTTELGLLKTTLSNQSGLKLLNSNYKWKPLEDGSLSLSIFFKVIDQSVRLPDIQTVFAVDGVDKESASLQGNSIAAASVNQTPKYCGVIASSLEVTNYKIDGYDATNNILAIDVSARYANLEDFKLQNIALQGINTLKNGFDGGKMFYYLIIPDTQKTLEFEYFDKENGSMKAVSVTLDLSNIEDKVSTQTDLQPKSSDKAIYVFLTVAVIASILYGIYYFKREKIFLILIVITIIAGVIFLFIPNEQVKIKKDTVVYLLPTENSTSFFKADADLPVEKLKESEGYIKIKMQDGKIGWVKGDSVVNR